MDDLGDILENMSNKSKAYGCCSCITILTATILLALSFDRVSVTEYGLL
jgi:hypothetical protein